MGYTIFRHTHIRTFGYLKLRRVLMVVAFRIWNCAFCPGSKYLPQSYISIYFWEISCIVANSRSRLWESQPLELSEHYEHRRTARPKKAHLHAASEGNVRSQSKVLISLLVDAQMQNHGLIFGCLAFGNLFWPSLGIHQPGQTSHGEPHPFKIP